MARRAIAHCAALALVLTARAALGQGSEAPWPISASSGNSSADGSAAFIPFGENEEGVIATTEPPPTPTTAPPTRWPMEHHSHRPRTHRPASPTKPTQPPPPLPGPLDEEESPPPPSSAIPDAPLPTPPSGNRPDSTEAPGVLPPKSSPQIITPPPTTLDPLSPSPSRVPSPSPAQQQQPGSTPTAADDENRDAAAPTPAPTTTASTAALTTASPGTGDQTPSPKRYTRGDEVMIIGKDLGNGTIVNIEVIISSAGSSALVVRDANTLSAGGDQSSSASSSGGVVTLLHYVFPLLALLSLLMLIGTHFAALVPAWTSSTVAWKRPNQWELLLFITYLQSVASVAFYVVRAAPHSVWEFTDGFSWVVFIPFHRSGSAIGSSATPSRRRLVDVVVLDGLVAFADRIGVKEIDLLQTSVAGLLVLCGAVLVIGVLVFVYTRRQRDTEPEHSTQTAHKPAEDQRRPMLLVYGMVVILAVLALYPLTVMASFEISSEVRAAQFSPSALAIAVLMVALVCGSLTIRSLWVFASIADEDEYKRRRHCRAVWGVLCSSDHIKFASRLLFVGVWLATQLASAVVVGVGLSMVSQLSLLVGVHCVSLVYLVVARPFVDGHRIAVLFSCTISVIKIANTTLAFAFGSSAVSGSGVAFIVMNSTVLVAWFLRSLVLSLYVRRMAAQDGYSVVRESTGVPSPLSPSESMYASALYVIMPTTTTSDGNRQTAIL